MGRGTEQNTCWRLCPQSQQLFLCEDGWCVNCIGDGEGRAVKGPLQTPTCATGRGEGEQGQPSKCLRTMLSLSQLIAVSSLWILSNMLPQIPHLCVFERVR